MILRCTGGGIAIVSSVSQMTTFRGSDAISQWCFGGAMAPLGTLLAGAVPVGAVLVLTSSRSKTTSGARVRLTVLHEEPCIELVGITMTGNSVQISTRSSRHSRSGRSRSC